MLYFANWKIALICAICALGVLLSLPNLFSQSLLAQVPRLLPHTQVALGLDLRGGSYLLLQVDVAAAQRERLNSLIDNVRNALRDANIGYTGLDVSGDAIAFTIREPDRIDDARQALRKIDRDLTVDIAEGVRVRVLRSTISSVLAKPDPAAAREAAKQKAEARAKVGTKE